ncbi:MAG TPA: hypothetical protein DHW02_10325 [Ktedonobacter sp.]|nr:hypothetical protein [Ktedonobacter sp.]
MKLAPPTIDTNYKTQLTQHPGRERRMAASFTHYVLAALLFITIAIAVSIGPTSIPLSVVVRVLLNGTGLFHFARHWDSSTELIIWNYRMPSVIGAALVGMALSVAGALFQGMLRNPLADPFLIGSSSGAALGAAVAFVLPFDTVYGAFFPLTPVLAFVGAMVTVLFVYAIARTGGQTPVVTLLLAGVVVNAVLTAFQTLILTFAPNEEFRFRALFGWLAGSVNVVGWWSVLVVAIIVLLGCLCSLGVSHVLDVFALGEESAAHLGLHVERYKFLIIILASLLTAAAVSISGLIGFVGLVIPHMMRLILGPRHRGLLLSSMLSGAIFLMLADLVSRTLSLPVGVFTALVGAPFFLFLLRRGKREYRW